jgi:hypothetical protein
MRLQLNDWPPLLSHAIAFGIGAASLAMTVEGEVEPLRIARGYVLMNRFDLGPLSPSTSHSTLAQKETLTILRESTKSVPCKMGTVDAMTFRTADGGASVFRLEDIRKVLLEKTTVIEANDERAKAIGSCTRVSQVLYDR